MITLNKIVKELESFVSRHRQLNDFRFGDIEKVGEDAINYPCLTVLINDGNEFNEQSENLNMTFVVENIPNKTNEYRSTLEVLSDCKLIANDVVSFFKKNYFGYYLEVLLPVQMNSFTKAGKDLTSGWSFNLTIKLANGIDACQIPLVDAPTPEDLNVVKIVNQEGVVRYRLTAPATFTITEFSHIVDTIINNETNITDNIID